MTKSVGPINYRISVEPDLEQFTFHGQTEILVEAIEPTTEVKLDAVELTILRCTVQIGPRFVNCSFRAHAQKETLTITLPEERLGRFLLGIEYTGSINDKMAGFYRSHVVTPQQERTIAVTQFQERDARRAFPCFDHPVNKATFDVEMIINEELTAISNGPIVEEKPVGNGKKCVRFGQTPKMSTYLLFFGVGQFEFIQDPKAEPVRVAAMPGMRKHGRFALDFGRKSLEFCERYYAIDFPLPKLDLIAIPDFAFGAMENWGAITFRENLLLHEPDLTSKAAEERICETIAHEIAHQWFGNLVSPADWKYLWLNESFATYFAYGVVHHYHPEWDIWDQFLHGETDQALERDGFRETFPIELPGGPRMAITASTAPIIYNKGGSILRQVEGYIGRDYFKKGLRNYLKTHEYDCTASHHLWEAFERVSEKPITRMMRSWIEQPGFPLVEVERSQNRLILTQKRFTYLPDNSTQSWLIPVSVRLFYKNGDSRSIATLVEHKRQRIDIGPDVLTYKVNDRQMGFYRVMYKDRGVLDELGKKVLKKDLSTEDRWGLQNDLYAFVQRGDLTIEDYLGFLSHYRNENDFLPLISIAGNLFQAFMVTRGAKKKKVASLARSLLERALSEIGFTPEPQEKHTRSILRDRILWHAVLYGSAPAKRFALEKFRSLVSGGAVHPDLRKSVMQVGALNGEKEGFDWFDQRLKSSENEHERMNVLIALGCFRDKRLITKAQRYVLDHVPSRNKFIPIVSMASNPSALPHLWEWYLSNLDELETFHPIHYERVILGIVPLAGIGREQEVRAFFKDYVKKKKTPKEVVRLSLEKLEIYSRMNRL